MKKVNLNEVKQALRLVLDRNAQLNKRMNASDFLRTNNVIREDVPHHHNMCTVSIQGVPTYTVKTEYRDTCYGEKAVHVFKRIK